MTGTGAADINLEIVDVSAIINKGIKGIAGVVGRTIRGPIAKPVIVGSWIEFVRTFGGLTDDSIFPHICKRALDSGARLKVVRTAHYTDVDGTTTAVKATAVVAGVNFEAYSEGEWANGISIEIKAASSGITSNCDIEITSEVDGIPSSLYQDFPLAWDTADVDVFNNASDYIKIVATGSANPILPASFAAVAMAGGVYAIGTIVEADYVGHPVPATGLYALDKESDMVRVAVPEIATPTMDDAITNYVVLRQTIRGLIRTPVGLNSLGILDYRNRTGTFNSGVPIDTFRMSMVTGGLRVRHPQTNAEMDFVEIGDMLALYSQKDSRWGEWFAAAGANRGKVFNALGVVYNMGTASRKLQADAVDNAGINMFIEHESFGVVNWGNGTLQRKATLLSHENIAELVMFMLRSLKTLVESVLFDPNDFETWKSVYRRVIPFLDFLKDNRAIFEYEYQGDQFAESLDDLAVNKPENIDAGVYRLIIGIKPTPALKYIYLQLSVNNSGATFSVTETSPI